MRLGALAAETYRFAYADGAFDLVIATSLFTHLLPAAAEHYLSEAARVLAPGGRLFCTWLLFSAARPAPAGFTSLDGAGALIGDPAVPEAAVAYDEGWLTEQLAARRLSRHALAHGTWSGLEGRSLQDIVVAQRH